MTREKAFVIFLIVNAFVALLYFIINLFTGHANRRMATVRAVVMLLAPGVGPLLFGLSYLGYALIFRKDVDLSDVMFSKEREKELVRTNEDRDRNVVPLEEAIEITDNTELRNLVMNVAQGDYNESLSAIALALNCEDTETAHYAASVLQDALNSFRINVQKGYQEVMKREDDCFETGENLIRYMNQVLVQDVFSDVEQKSFAGQMDETAQIMYEEKPEKFTGELYEMVSLQLLKVEAYERCEVWCDRSMTAFPSTLSSYTCKLKLYFNSGNKEKFFEVMNDLKASSVVIDKETLSLIRTFQE